MQVVVLLLLVAGLALLVLGLITGSTPLVLTSIAASLLAAMAILRYRRRQEGRGVGVPAADEARDGATAQVRTPERVPALASVAGEPGPGAASPGAVPLAEGAVSPAQGAVPPAHAAGPAHAAAEREDPAEPEHRAAPNDPAEPEHLADVPAEPEELAEPEKLAEPEELAQPEGLAEADDLADPEPAEADTDPPLRSRGDEPVWVIDGRPRYHLSGCAFLLGRGPEPVPLRQAVEDGFTPCALCDPDSGLAAG